MFQLLASMRESIKNLSFSSKCPIEELMSRIVTFFIIMLFPLLSVAEGVRIVDSSVFDQGSFTGDTFFQVDSVQDNCDTSGEEFIPEPFADTSMGLTVVSSLNQNIVFSRFRYRLRYRDDSGKRRRKRVRKLGVFSNFIVPSFSEGTEVLVPLFNAFSRRKHFANSTRMLPVEGGFSRLRVVLLGRTESGARVRVRAQTTVSIGNVDRC